MSLYVPSIITVSKYSNKYCYCWLMQLRHHCWSTGRASVLGSVPLLLIPLFTSCSDTTRTRYFVSLPQLSHSILFFSRSICWYCIIRNRPSNHQIRNCRQSNQSLYCRQIHQGLKNNTDGSLDIYIQHDNPEKDKESTWLPVKRMGGLDSYTSF